MECSTQDWLHIFAGLTPWVQIIVLFIPAAMLVGLAHCLTRPFTRGPVEMVHYVAKEDRP